MPLDTVLKRGVNEMGRFRRCANVLWFGLVRRSGDKLHRRLWIARRQRVMALAVLDQHGDLAAEFGVALFRHTGLAVESRILAAAHVKNGHAGFGQRRQIIERLGLSGIAVQDRIFSIDA